MSIEITQMPKNEAILRTKTRLVRFPISKFNQTIIKKMIDHVDKSQLANFKGQPAIGIAANQINQNLRMFYVNVPLTKTNKKLKNYQEFLINPTIIAKSISKIALKNGEACLSVPTKYPKTGGLVLRNFKIIIEAYSYFQKKVIKITKHGYVAIVLQHEMDHLNGKLFFDRINQKEPWKQEEKLTLV